MKRRHVLGSHQATLQLMILPGAIWFLVFAYFPMYGLIIAFTDFHIAKGLWGSPIVGLAAFRELLTDPEIPDVIMNTVGISLLKLLIAFPAPIVLALLLNEIQSTAFKRVVQTASYLPHFISWIVLSLVVTYWLSADIGLVNKVLLGLRVIQRPINFLGDPDAFWWLAVLSEVWKETGWGAIIYLASLSTIDPSLYEAAALDGVNRFQRIRHITLPGISGTIIIMFLLNFGMLFSGGLASSNFEQSFFLGNAVNYNKSMVIEHYVLRTGIMLGRFSYATAVGLLRSIVSLVLLGSSNFICRRVFGRSLYSEGEL